MTPPGGLFSRAAPFVKALRIHVHRPLPILLSSVPVFRPRDLFRRRTQAPSLKASNPPFVKPSLEPVSCLESPASRPGIDPTLADEDRWLVLPCCIGVGYDRSI